jgi:thioredoxin reductase (NADPH)
MEKYDCILIGGGPAGLTAAVYLARFCLQVLVIDNNQSRAALIPTSHNFMAFPNGISGKLILKRMHQQLMPYQHTIIKDNVTKISRGFIVNTSKSTYKAKFVIIATGLIDIEPKLPNLINAIQTGLIRHCPVCDGYEVKNQKIAILCNNKKGIREALFLSTYTNDITLFSMGFKLKLSTKEEEILKKLNIKLISCPISKLKIVKNKITSLTTLDNKCFAFESIYSALGAALRSKLAVDLGVKHTKDHQIIVNEHQETNIKNCYAAGDIVTGLNQICIAVSQGALAAVNIYQKILKMRFYSR